jgi:hypothetical protein
MEMPQRKKVGKEEKSGDFWESGARLKTETLFRVELRFSQESGRRSIVTYSNELEAGLTKRQEVCGLGSAVYGPE